VLSVAGFCDIILLFLLRGWVYSGLIFPAVYPRVSHFRDLMFRTLSYVTGIMNVRDYAGDRSQGLGYVQQ